VLRCFCMYKLSPGPWRLQIEHDEHMNIEHFWRGLRMSDLSSERGKLATAVPHLKQKGGLINLGSVASDFAFPLQGNSGKLTGTVPGTPLQFSAAITKQGALLH